MRRTDLVVAVDPRSGPPELDDVVVTLVPASWGAARLVRAAGRTRNLVTGMVIVGWSGTRELRLARGRDVDRLGPVADLVASALHSAQDRSSTRHPLTLTNVPDGHQLFDELATGRKVVLVELAPSAPEAVQRWLRVLSAAADDVTDRDSHDVDEAPHDRHPA